MITFGKFTLRLAAFSGIVAVGIKLLQNGGIAVPSNVWGPFIFFVLLTLVLYWITTYSFRMSVANSMKITLGSMFFRLFASFIYLVIYMIINKQKDIPFVIAFMVLYLLFTVFEIYHIVANLRPDSKKQ